MKIMDMHLKSVGVFLFLLLVTIQAQAQQNFSLQECIEFSLQHHASVNINQNNILVAKEEKKQAISNYLPQANGSLNITDNMKIQTTIIPAGILGPKEVEMQFGKQYSNNATIDLSQAIYDQTRINNIRAGKVNVQVAELQNKQNSESLIYNTAQAYFQVLIYKEYESKLLDNIQTYSQLSQILELQYKKGVVLETDVDRIKVNLKSTEYQLNEVSTQWKNALGNLKYAMGLPLEAELSITDSANFAKYAFYPNGSSFIIDSLSDISISKKNIELQKINYKNKKSAFLPTVNTFARIGNQAYSEDFSTSFDKWKDYSYIGVSVSVPIFSSLRRASQVKESKLIYTNACTNLELVQKNYQLRFQNNYKSLLTAYNSLSSNKDNLDLAGKIYSKTNLNYQKGTVPLTDFLNDDTALKNAQTNYINSLFSYMMARLDYEKAKGTLFSFFNQLKNN